MQLRPGPAARDLMRYQGSRCSPSALAASTSHPCWHASPTADCCVPQANGLRPSLPAGAPDTPFTSTHRLSGKDRHAAVALQRLTAQSDPRPQTRPSFVSQARWDSISLCLPSTVSQHLSGCLSQATQTTLANESRKVGRRRSWPPEHKPAVPVVGLSRMHGARLRTKKLTLRSALCK